MRIVEFLRQAFDPVLIAPSAHEIASPVPANLEYAGNALPQEFIFYIEIQ